MPDLGRLSAEMTLDGKGFISPLETARAGMEQLRGVGEKLTGILSVLGISFASFKGAEGITEGMKGVLELGKELEAQHRITGEHIGDLVVLSQAYKEAGMDAGSVTQSLVMLQTALGGVNAEGQPTKEIFRQLGLNMAQLKTESAIQQFDAISKALAALKDHASQIAAIRQIFGRQGAQMEALFANPQAIQEARAAVGQFGTTMQENAAIFARVSNEFELLGEQSQHFFAGLASQVAPELDQLLTKIKGIDLTGLGKQVGKVVATLVEAFKPGNFSTLLSLAIQAGGEEGLEFLVRGLFGFTEAMQEAVTEGLELLSDSNFWGAVGDMIKGAFDGLDAVILAAFEPAFAMLQAQIEQAISDLTHGKIDPMKAGLTAQIAGDNASILRMQAQEDTTLANPKLSDAEKSDRYSQLDQVLAPLRKEYNELLDAKLNGITTTDRYERNMATGGIMDTELGGLLQNAGAGLSAAAARMQAVVQGDYLDPKAVVQKFMDGFKSQIGALGLPSGAASQLAKTWEGLQQKISSVMPTPADQFPDGAGTNSIAAVKGMDRKLESASDRFSKIGLFIGHGGPQADWGRKTADNTAKMVALLGDLVTHHIQGATGGLSKKNAIEVQFGF
jgi:hypothetical protein